MEKKCWKVNFQSKGNSIQNLRTGACTSSNKALRRRVFACVNGRPRPVNSPAEPACSRRSPVAEPNTARRQKRVESPRRRLHPVLLFSTFSLLSLLFRDSLPTPSVPLLPLTFFFLPLPRVTWVVVTSPSDRRPQVCPPVTGAGGREPVRVRGREREGEGRGLGFCKWSFTCAHMVALTHAPHPSLAVTLARQRDFNQTGPSI